jgi:hypothetical protein
MAWKALASAPALVARSPAVMRAAQESSARAALQTATAGSSPEAATDTAFALSQARQAELAFVEPAAAATRGA